MNNGGGLAFRVLVTDQLTAALVNGGQPVAYLSPPQPEHDARLLIRMLLGRSQLEGPGPWRQAIAGGQRLIELQAAP